MNLRIACCDDEPEIGKMLARKIADAFSEINITASTTVFSDPKQLLSLAESGCSFDAIFLDIDMPELDGITLGKKLSRLMDRVGIVFLSNKEDMVFRALQVMPLRFIRKNRFDEEIRDAVQAICARTNDLQRDTVVFEDANTVYRFFPSKILYVEIMNMTLSVVQESGKTQFRSTISEAEQKLSPYGFLRIHKSFLVNYRAVFSIKKDSVSLENGTVLPISRHRYQDVKREYLRFYRIECS